MTPLDFSYCISRYESQTAGPGIPQANGGYAFRLGAFTDTANAMIVIDPDPRGSRVRVWDKTVLQPYMKRSRECVAKGG